MELQPVRSDEEWDALLADRPDASLYHTSAWLHFQADQFGYDLRMLVIQGDSGPVGLFPVFLVKRAIFRVAASPRGVDYLNLGPLVSADLLGETLDCYERWVSDKRVDFTSVAFMREIDTDVASSRGYSCETHKLCLVDLRVGEEAVFKGCKSSCRRAIRKSERMGVKIVESGLEPHLDLYLRLSDRIYAKSGTKSPLTKSVLSGMLNALSNAGQLLTIRAEVDGKVIGMYVVGHYGKTGYSLDIVSDHEFPRFAASNLMTWYEIRWCVRHGFETFDLGGARIPSLARFKTSFGAEIVPYTNMTKAHSKLARSATWLKNVTVDWVRAVRFRRSRKGELSRELPPPGGSASG